MARNFQNWIPCKTIVEELQHRQLTHEDCRSFASASDILLCHHFMDYPVQSGTPLVSLSGFGIWSYVLLVYVLLQKSKLCVCRCVCVRALVCVSVRVCVCVCVTVCVVYTCCVYGKSHLCVKYVAGAACTKAIKPCYRVITWRRFDCRQSH